MPTPPAPDSSWRPSRRRLRRQPSPPVRTRAIPFQQRWDGGTLSSLDMSYHHPSWAYLKDGHRVPYGNQSVALSMPFALPDSVTTAHMGAVPSQACAEQYKVFDSSQQGYMLCIMLKTCRQVTEEAFEETAGSVLEICLACPCLFCLVLACGVSLGAEDCAPKP